MSEPDSVFDLLKYYSPGQPDPILMRKANAMLGRSTPEAKAAAIDWIIEHIPRQDGKYRHDLSVTDIKTALQEVGQPVDDYVPAEEWACDLCGLKFQYAQVVSYADKHDKGIFDYCPRCGFQPCDTLQANLEAKLQGKDVRAWYGRRMDEFRVAWGIRQKSGNGWIFDKKEDDDFEAKKRKDLVESMKREASEAIAKLTRERKA
jgi:hypothetical protein